MLLLAIFVPSDDIGVLPQLFLMAAYGYLLFRASELISEGSEQLLALYGPGIVGGLLIPVLGAVPDGAVILASGLGNGSKEEIQDELRVGVGCLSGSTIMLLCTWGVAMLIGRRDLDPETGEAASYVDARGRTKPKLTESWTKTVATTNAGVPKFAVVMMVSALSYLIIQVPAFFYKSDQSAAHEEKPYALVGLIVSLAGFAAYSAYQLHDSNYEEHVKKLQREAERQRWKASLARKFGSVDAFSKVFRKFDYDKSGFLERRELTDALRSLGLDADRREVSTILQSMDADRDGRISEGEFTSIIAKWLSEHAEAPHDGYVPPNVDDGNGANEPVQLDHMSPAADQPLMEGSDAGADDDEEEEEEEEYHELSDSELRWKAISLLVCGTVLVTIFSDPMVEVINNFGDTIGVSPFYISFVVTPLASNASEVISAVVFAKKRTTRTMSLTFASVYGAVTLNSTFGLGIFMGLVYFRGLKWSFSAEVIAILFVTVCVGLNGLRRTVTAWQAVFVIALYPASIALVAGLEAAGLD